MPSSLRYMNDGFFFFIILLFYIQKADELNKTPRAANCIIVFQCGVLY